MKGIKLKPEKMIFFSILLIICSCSLIGQNDELEMVIKNKYESCSNTDDCLVNLRSDLQFEWDSMYVFGVNATPKFISNIIKINYDKSKDLTRVIIFTKGDQIVHEIRNELNPERPFSFRITGDRRVFSKDNAVFSIQKTTDYVFDLTLKD